jgi:hypothetical protein
VRALAQKSVTCFVPKKIAAALWRLALAAAWPRAEFIAEFAALSQILIRGFFFNQGFLIGGSAEMNRRRCGTRYGPLRPDELTALCTKPQLPYVSVRTIPS